MKKLLLITILLTATSISANNLKDSNSVFENFFNFIEINQNSNLELLKGRDDPDECEEEDTKPAPRKNSNNKAEEDGTGGNCFN